MKLATINRQVAGLALSAVLAGFSANALAGLSEGLTLFNSYCAVCHGVTGEGQAMGKSLVDDSAKGLEDLELLAVIRNGREGTGMAAWGDSLSAEELLDTANYVRAMQGKLGIVLEAEDPIADDPIAIAGRELFNGSAQCSSCHTVGGAGGRVGPVLDGVYAKLGDDGLQEAFAKPSAKFSQGFPVKEVELQDGTVISGVARNETETSLQIQSLDGKLWRTYFKDRVQEVRDSKTSVMPEIYRDLNRQQRQQILAYLRSL